MTTLKNTDNTASTAASSYLKAKFQVGSGKSDKINYGFTQKVFHRGDIPENVLQAKQAVLKSIEPRILEVDKQEWQQSTLKGKIQQQDRDLKRKLLLVRAGLMDRPVTEGPKGGRRTQEEIDETIRYIVSVTGKGPIGFLTNKWFDANDERRLAKHTANPEKKWKSWRESIQTGTKQDLQEREAIFQEKERIRVAKNIPEKRLSGPHHGPMQQVHEFNQCLRDKKIEYQDLKEQFKMELKTEFPYASEERLQAMAQRLIDEKLRSDQKLARCPLEHESFRPNLSLTTMDRRYREYFHQGAWTFNDIEQRFTWTCCMNNEQKSRGCESRTINPDSWCLQHC